MDHRKRTRRFAALVRKERKLSESPEVSHQSISAARLEQIQPPSIPEESTPSTVEKDESSVGRTRKRKLFLADPERLLLSQTGSEETKLVVLEHETRSKELAEGKLFINWPDSMAWEILWIGYVWGLPFAIEESLMDFYEYMWYPPYTKGVDLGYGNPDAVAVYDICTEPARHPTPQLGQHFVTESSQSKSLEAGSTEKLLTCLVDYVGAEKAFAEIDTASDGLSQRRASLKGLVAESAPSPLLLTETEEPEVKETVAAEATETEVIPTVGITIPAIFTANEELETMKCSEGVGPSIGEPTEVESQSKAPIISSENIIAAVVSAGEGPDPAGEPKINISESQLERFMEKYMMKRLSNNWSLKAYKKKIDDCVARSIENKYSISQINQTLGEFGDMLRAMEKNITALGEGATTQEAVTTNLRKDIDQNVAGHNSLTTQVVHLHTAAEKSLAEILSIQGSLLKMSAESTTQWSRHDVDHVGISARLSGLEELRRLDNVSRGQEKVTDFFSIKMDGFQECLEVQIAHGLFDRRILNNAKFMDLVKDKDALRSKLVEKDKEIHWRGGPSKK